MEFIDVEKPKEGEPKENNDIDKESVIEYMGEAVFFSFIEFLSYFLAFW